MIREYQKVLNKVLIVIDIIVISFSLLVAYWLKFHSGLFTVVSHLSAREYARGLIIFVPIFIFLNYFFELYTSQRSRRFFYELFTIIKSNVLGLALIMSFLFVFKEVHYSRGVLLLFVALHTLFSSFERYALRIILRNMRSKGYNRKFLLIVGAGSLGRKFLAKVRQHREFGYQVIGFLDDDETKQGEEIDGIKVIGTLNDIEKITKDQLVDEAIVALPLTAYNRLQKLINVCERIGLKMLIIPDYYDYIPAIPKVVEFDDIPLLNIRHVPLDQLANMTLKRLFDIVVSLLILIICGPLMLLIALGIKITAPGPVIFKQERVGLNRKNFVMYKFRSMKVLDKKEEEKCWTTKDDPRKTKFGAFLRKTSLDELPQFINVLKGDMSIIGPRPERPHFVEQFKEEIPKYMIKHHVRPGITGWAQVNGWRGDTSIAERIKCDLYYVENWTWTLELKIFFMTFYKGLINKNAY